MTPKPTPHLEPAAIASYVDGLMSQTERNLADDHFADCHQCTGLLAGIIRTSDELRAAIAVARPPVAQVVGGR